MSQEKKIPENEQCEGTGVDAQRAPTLAGCLHPHTCPELKRCCAPGLCNHKGEIP